jgi:hypothetical protein
MGQPGQSQQLAPPPPMHKNLQKEKSEALQYCDNNEFMELTRLDVLGGNKQYLHK